MNTDWNPDSLIGPEGVLLKKDGEHRYSQGRHLVAGCGMNLRQTFLVKEILSNARTHRIFKPD
ncbi:MAG: hypothetical protein FWH27_09660 [Planctomycetaceae bacterium]|nr:hypothetical protein [Planctomycetaceae bacterium]